MREKALTERGGNFGPEGRGRCVARWWDCGYFCIRCPVAARRAAVAPVTASFGLCASLKSEKNELRPSTSRVSGRELTHRVVRLLFAISSAGSLSPADDARRLLLTTSVCVSCFPPCDAYSCRTNAGPGATLDLLCFS